MSESGQLFTGRSRQAVTAENLLVIVCISGRSVSSTVAVMHPTHGDKVIAHKSIDVAWAGLSQVSRQHAVAEVLRYASESAGVEPFSVFVSLADPSIASHMTMGSADLGEALVMTRHEKDWALMRSRDQSMGGETVLEVIPVRWLVHDAQGRRDVADPIGERGHRLTCHALQVTARAGYLEAIDGLIRPLGIGVEGVIAQPVALYRGICSSLPRSGSAVIIDCGARCTTIIVRQRDRLVHFQSHDFGGDDLTQAVADGLHVTMAQAEELKRGLDVSLHSDPDSQQDGQQFIWREVGERHRLAKPAAAIVGELIDQFFNARAQEMRDAGILGQQGQVYLFGRASALNGLSSRIKEAVGLKVHLGTGRQDRDPGVEMSDAMTLGLVRTAADRRRQHLAANPRKVRTVASGILAWMMAPIK